MQKPLLALFLSICLIAVAAEVPLVEYSPRGGLSNVLSKLERGEAVRVAYLGGSITAQDGWRPKTFVTVWPR
jgi:hypothetical protein